MKPYSFLVALLAATVIATVVVSVVFIIGFLIELIFIELMGWWTFLAVPILVTWFMIIRTEK